MDTKNNYSKILLDNQKDYLDAQKELTVVLTQMKDALTAINDTNILHCSKEDERYHTIEKLAVAVEARSKVMNTVFILMAMAVVILAGAEKALEFIRI